MTIDEMVIQVRVTAEGVKQGVAVATTELKKLEEQKKKLQEDLKIKVSAPDLVKLRGDLEKLETEKKRLETAVKFSVESENLRQLKQDLTGTIQEKQMLEEDLKIHMDIADMVEAEKELERLTQEKRRLEEEIKLQIKTDAEIAKKDLNEVNQKIDGIKKDIAIHMETSGINEAANGLRQVDAELKEVEKSASDMEKQFPKVAAVATAAFAAIVVAIKSGTDAFNKVYKANPDAMAKTARKANKAYKGLQDLKVTKAISGLKVTRATSDRKDHRGSRARTGKQSAAAAIR